MIKMSSANFILYLITLYTLIILSNSQLDPCIRYGSARDCLNCTQGYYINRNKSCSIADPLCRTYNSSNGNCTSCNSSYDLINGKCCLSSYYLDAFGNCQPPAPIFCPNRYYLDSNNKCQPVNPSCDTYNNKTGACITCKPGFVLIEGGC